jgi:hypothetical protein
MFGAATVVLCQTPNKSCIGLVLWQMSLPLLDVSSAITGLLSSSAMILYLLIIVQLGLEVKNSNILYVQSPTNGAFHCVLDKCTATLCNAIVSRATIHTITSRASAHWLAGLLSNH